MNELQGSGFGFPDQEADWREIAILLLVFDSIYAYDGLPIFKKAGIAKLFTGLWLNSGTLSVVGAVEIHFNDV